MEQEVQDDLNKKAFGPREEEAIISLMFDQPEFITPMMQYLKPEYFRQIPAKMVFSIVYLDFVKNGVIMTRELCKDVLERGLTADDPHKEIFDLIDRKSDPREVPVVSDTLLRWARNKCLGLLYEEDMIEAHDHGEYEGIIKIFEDFTKIINVGANCWFFFDRMKELFVDDTTEHLTTGFPALDKYVNFGGPARGEVFCFMAPTGRGKSIALASGGAANLKKAYDGGRGHNVLHVTFELSTKQTALRYMGCLTNVWIESRFDRKDEIIKIADAIQKTYGSMLIIKEFPPDEVSVDAIYSVIDTLRKVHGINVDVVVLDYLELMMSRVPEYNKDDYMRQKKVSTEIAGLAKKENVLVLTATQTNRSGTEGTEQGKQASLIDINKVAESYGKTMPIDYLVTINQTASEYKSGVDGGEEDVQCRLYIVKNRTGPMKQTVAASINYKVMRMSER